MVTFDAPGAGTTSKFGTFPRGINAKAVITGNYGAADEEANRGFLRNP